MPLKAAVAAFAAFAGVTSCHGLGGEAVSMLRAPTEADLSAAELAAYWRQVKAFEDASTVSADTPISTFPSADVLKHFSFNPKGVQEGLQGIWWFHNHPTFGEALFSFRGADKTFEGNAGTNLASSNYTYVSNVLAGGLAVPNNPKNVSKFVWLAEQGLEYALPFFNSSVEMGAGSFLNTHMNGFYGKFPLPAALVEGWTLPQFLKWQKHMSESHDVAAAARCFCSFYWTGPDKIDRNNFGHFAYPAFRLVDGAGRATKHLASFLESTAAAGTTSFAVIAPSARSEGDVVV